MDGEHENGGVDEDDRCADDDEKRLQNCRIEDADDDWFESI